MTPLSDFQAKVAKSNSVGFPHKLSIEDYHTLKKEFKFIEKPNQLKNAYIAFLGDAEVNSYEIFFEERCYQRCDKEAIEKMFNLSINEINKFYRYKHIRKKYEKPKTKVKTWDKLKQSAEKHLAMFKYLKSKSVLTDEEKRQARMEIIKYNKIKKVIKGYEKGR